MLNNPITWSEELIQLTYVWVCYLGWAIAAGFFGLAFGALCAIANMFIGGFGYGIAWWISGIEFDLIHCAGNFVIVLVAFKPLRQLMEKLYQK